MDFDAYTSKNTKPAGANVLLMRTLLIVSALVATHAHADDSIARAVVTEMRFAELVVVKFQQGYLESCSRHENETYCRNTMPDLDQKKLEDIYTGAMEKALSNSQLRPISEFLASPNGQLFTEITYLQTVSGKQWTPDMPHMTEEKFDAINAYRASGEWQTFESGMPRFHQEAGPQVKAYILSEGAAVLDRISLVPE